MKTSRLIIFSLLLFIENHFVYSGQIQKLQVAYNSNSQILFVMDHNIHIKYGFLYPITYEFELPSNSTNLSVFAKYKNNEVWNHIIEKTGNDFFNGIEVVRFDYPNNRAYLFIAFNSESDTLFFKIVNNLGNNIDWILVLLKKNPDDTNYISEKIAFLKKDASVLDFDGKSPLHFNIEHGNYYIVVHHRNHIPIRSSIPVHFE
jgi:hypothetical protein